MVPDTTEILSANKPFYRAEFHFHDDHLAYFGKYWDFRVRYEHLPPVTKYTESRSKEIFSLCAFVYCVLAALALLMKEHNPHYGTEGFYWAMRSLGLFLAIACAVVAPIYFVEKKEFTVLPTYKGNILVPHGATHDRILKSIERSRFLALKRVFAVHDLANTPEEEVGKFAWLKDEGAITAEEYAELCRHATAAA